MPGVNPGGRHRPDSAFREAQADYLKSVHEARKSAFSFSTRYVATRGIAAGAMIPPASIPPQTQNTDARLKTPLLKNSTVSN